MLSHKVGYMQDLEICVAIGWAGIVIPSSCMCMRGFPAMKIENRNWSLEKLGRPSGTPRRRNVRRKSHHMLYSKEQSV